MGDTPNDDGSGSVDTAAPRSVDALEGLAEQIVWDFLGLPIDDAGVSPSEDSVNRRRLEVLARRFDVEAKLSIARSLDRIAKALESAAGSLAGIMHR